MSRPNTSKEKLQDRLQELKALRDTIRVDLHLASMELRDEWEGLEGRLPEAAAAVEQVKEVTTEALDRLAGQLRSFRARLRGKGERIADLMSGSIVACAPTDSLARAVALMWNHDLGWLPVLDDVGKLCGVVTDRDAAIAAATRGRSMDEIAVDSVMARDLATCTADATPGEALTLMRARQLRRLAVVNLEGKLEGVITIGDLARARAPRPEALPDGAGPAAVLATLARIESPSSPPQTAN